tara:strand:+ start:141 stop:752 length:612 start_codon:yes stop_codon:yes gene_type:complete
MTEFINIDYYVQNLFSVPIHYLSINDFDSKKQELIDYAYNLRDSDEQGRTASNRGGYQSLAFPVKGGDILQDLLINVISNIPSFKNNVDVVCDSWVNINPPHSFNVKHCHPNCDIAGVLWIKIPEKSGDIVFHSPYNYISYNEMICYTRGFQEKGKYFHDYKFPAREGNLLLFPAHIEHKVGENNSDEDRISVSFNLKLIDNN